MTYITYDDYAAYNGIEISTEDFPQYAARASEAVDAATGWKLSMAGGIAGYSEFIRGQIILACCAQCEYLYLEGADAALAGAENVGGYHIGKASQTTGSGSRAAGVDAGAGMLCQKALDALMPTGLLYAGVPVAW
jgi:hypothetical protein